MAGQDKKPSAQVATTLARVSASLARLVDRFEVHTRLQEAQNRRTDLLFDLLYDRQPQSPVHAGWPSPIIPTTGPPSHTGTHPPPVQRATISTAPPAPSPTAAQPVPSPRAAPPVPIPTAPVATIPPPPGKPTPPPDPNPNAAPPAVTGPVCSVAPLSTVPSASPSPALSLAPPVDYRQEERRDETATTATTATAIAPSSLQRTPEMNEASTVLITENEEDGPAGLIAEIDDGPAVLKVSFGVHLEDKLFVVAEESFKLVNSRPKLLAAYLFTNNMSGFYKSLMGDPAARYPPYMPWKLQRLLPDLRLEDKPNLIGGEIDTAQLV